MKKKKNIFHWLSKEEEIYEIKMAHVWECVCVCVGGCIYAVNTIVFHSDKGKEVNTMEIAMKSSVWM